MKKLLFIFIILCMTISIANAEISILDSKEVRHKGKRWNYTFVLKTICMEGYKFAYQNDNDGANFIQIIPPQTCNNNNIKGGSNIKK